MSFRTTPEAISTMERLELLDKPLSFRHSWEPWEKEDVHKYLEGKKCSISVIGDLITFGDEEIDRESMELLCMLDLLDRRIFGWHEEVNEKVEKIVQGFIKRVQSADEKEIEWE